jgi:chloramphenicol O-acetyltransferase type A
MEMSHDSISEIEISHESIQDLLLNYKGQILDLDILSRYDQASMSYFIDRNSVRQPRVNITMALDITNAYNAFQERARKRDTFTSYLTWGLLASVRLHPHFSWRNLAGKWYAFNDLPVFIPVATGLSDNRLASVIINHVCEMDWDTFSEKYQYEIENACHGWINPFADILHWSVYYIVGNLPSIAFTSLTFHESGIETARPIFYFGRRYESQNKLFIPFAIQFHHATLDPILIDAFLADFLNLLT